MHVHVHAHKLTRTQTNTYGFVVKMDKYWILYTTYTPIVEENHNTILPHTPLLPIHLSKHANTVCVHAQPYCMYTQSQQSFGPRLFMRQACAINIAAVLTLKNIGCSPSKEQTDRHKLFAATLLPVCGNEWNKWIAKIYFRYPKPFHSLCSLH